jgi:8-oxo-dGTP pyrophosphatase MutT (NUDIX family)
MESGETPEQAAARELQEETLAHIDPENLTLFLIGSIPEISEVYLVYHGELAQLRYGLSEEALEVELYGQTDAPWEEFAYPDVAEFMQQFYLDHASRSYGVYAARYVEGIHTFRIVAR